MSQRDWGIDDPEERYWFNVKTGEVEVGKQSLSIDRLGPFETREEAQRATEILEERARKWAEEEARED
ncbi:MAG: methionine aminopeptidase [Microbacteriaceae bacterium]